MIWSYKEGGYKSNTWEGTRLENLQHPRVRFPPPITSFCRVLTRTLETRSQTCVLSTSYHPFWDVVIYEACFFLCVGDQLTGLIIIQLRII